jgi:putative transposase
MPRNVIHKRQDLIVAPEVLAVAKTRYAALEEFIRLTGRGKTSSRHRSDLALDLARRLEISLSTFYRLLARYSERGTVDALIPRTTAGMTCRRRLSKTAEAIIAKEIAEFYKTRERPRISDVVDRIRAHCHKEGVKRPHENTIRARIAALPRDEVHGARYGSRSAKEKFSPITGRFEADHPLQTIQIDHTKVDLMLVDENSGQPIGRPWLTLAIDIFTRMVVGFYLSFDPPSATSLAICLAVSVMDKSSWLTSLGIKGEWPVQGIPEIIHVDNGKEFHSRPFETACERYAISIQHRPPRTPHYGGHIERLIGTLMGAVHALPGTTFSSVAEKNNYDSEQRPP